MRAILELLRISLFPTAAADAAVGCLLGAGAWPGMRMGLAAMGASLCVYHGAMALNDWADRKFDAAARPGRPIPSGRVAPGFALLLALVLLLAGPLFALTQGQAAGLWMLCVALLAVSYDLFGRGALLGPALLGLCRAGNLGGGIWIGAQGGAIEPWCWAAVGAYGAYVFAISQVGRLEDAQGANAGRLPSHMLMLAALCCLVTPLCARSWTGLVPALVAACVLLRMALPVREWSREALVPTMGRALRLLLVLTASFALSSESPERWLVAAGVLCGYPLASALRQRFPPS